MEVELKSNWQEIQVELLKNLHGYEFKELNDETGYVDYVAKEEGDERKLLRVVVGPKLYASKAFVSNVEDSLEILEDEDYDEVTLMAENFTNASKRLVNEADNLEMISPGESLNSTTELNKSIRSLTASLCQKKCGGLPKKEEDCKGIVDGKYLCNVRRVSDDSDFHVRMNWQSSLMNDFSNLIELRRNMDQ